MEIVNYIKLALNPSFNWTKEEYNVVLSDHVELIDILGFLANTMFEKNIKDESYKYYSETFAYKYIYKSFNINTLLRGTNYKSTIFNFANNLFDVSSTYILLRALFENYLIFNYLYIQPKSKAEQKCKWIIYEISGLFSRQNFKSTNINYEDKIEKERVKIETLSKELITNSYFQSLDTGKQKDILKRKPAKIFGWQTIFTNSNLRSDIFIRAWRLCSNYAHTEYISLIQFKEYKQNSLSLNSTKHLIAFISLILSAVFVIDIIELYPEIKANFYKLTNEQQECIKLLSKIAQNTS